MAWILLLLAGVFEIVWASAMKLSAGFSRPAPTIAMIVFMFASFFLLAGAMRTLPLGTAYAIWTGIGAVGALVVGIAFFGESASPMRLTAAAMIVGGIALMKLSSTS